ncbi:hypothetical protein KJY73_09925 [Bowmanella sp. Y26]|uniref:DUF4198 domain-containing protein n=1 Tax=Bowmanella yangjiangensis TaxID=2811230 RepID=UPI001BDD2DBF|nr:DUF4198 domain-containing protein [Bowmanella yangjiangensis]MBT1063891.1 hypothetical protein [Bowmanella yangjiangensis]
MGRCFLILLFAMDGIDMGLFSKSMFTQVEGVVLLNGQPVQGAEVISSYDWSAKNEKKSKTVKTDENGKFHFPEWKSQCLLSLFFPMQPVISQKIIIIHNGNEYTAWRNIKNSYGNGDEVGVSPIKITCNLESRFSEKHKNGHYGICHLD